MTKQIRAKQERVIEAVRRGLEGDAAVDFIHRSGYAMTVAGIARHLRSMGGRGRIQELIDAGLTNVAILELCFPQEDLSGIVVEPPSQGELFTGASGTSPAETGESDDAPLYDTRKMSIKVPADLFEALRLASKAERKSQNQLIVEILTNVLSRMPRQLEEMTEQH